MDKVKVDQTYQVVEPKDGVAQPLPRAPEKPAREHEAGRTREDQDGRVIGSCAPRDRS